MKDKIINKLEKMQEEKTKLNRMAGQQKCFYVKEDMKRRARILQNTMDRLALNFNIFSKKLYTKVDQVNAEKIVKELMETA